jgi:single-strand DNA-binding protein
MVNKVLVIGRLGREPESRTTTSGGQVCSFSVAVNESWQNRDGSRQEHVEWVSCQSWGKTAEYCQKFLQKSTLVYVEGRLRTETWEGRSGDEKTATRVRVEIVRILKDGKRTSEDHQAVEMESAL